MQSVLIEVKDVTYYYEGNSPKTEAAVKNVSVEIKEGELWGIIGRTGSGKSTLVELMAGLIKPKSGTVLIEGADTKSKGHVVRELKGKVGLVFQYPEHQLFEETVLKDVCFGPKNLGFSESEAKRSAREAMRLMKLDESFEELSPFELSGGEKRRAAIAGVLAMKPDILILDEPTAGLDPVGRDSLFDMIQRVKASWCKSVVLVSHSMEDVSKMADHVLVMNEGRAVMQGSVRSVFLRSDELFKIGLDVPQISRLVSRLRDMGCDLRDDILTVEEAVEAICALKGDK